MAAIKRARTKSAATVNGETKAAGIGSAAVRTKTGKTWDAWVIALDRAGARTLGHAEIAELVHTKFGIGDWWTQMVTVGYEQLVGKRVVGQKMDGFSTTVSRTFDVPAAGTFRAFHDPVVRTQWLGENVTISKATASKSLRILWSDGKTRLDVNLYPKAARKTQISLQHSRLANARDARRMKAYWAGALDRLKAFL